MEITPTARRGRARRAAARAARPAAQDRSAPRGLHAGQQGQGSHRRRAIDPRTSAPPWTSASRGTVPRGLPAGRQPARPRRCGGHGIDRRQCTADERLPKPAWRRRTSCQEAAPAGGNGAKHPDERPDGKGLRRLAPPSARPCSTGRSPCLHGDDGGCRRVAPAVPPLNAPRGANGQLSGRGHPGQGGGPARRRGRGSSGPEAGARVHSRSARPHHCSGECQDPRRRCPLDGLSSLTDASQPQPQLSRTPWYQRFAPIRRLRLNRGLVHNIATNMHPGLVWRDRRVLGLPSYGPNRAASASPERVLPRQSTARGP